MSFIMQMFPYVIVDSVAPAQFDQESYCLLIGQLQADWKLLCPYTIYVARNLFARCSSQVHIKRGVNV